MPGHHDNIYLQSLTLFLASSEIFSFLRQSEVSTSPTSIILNVLSKEFKGENGSGSKDRYKITSTFSTVMKTEEEVKVMMMTGRKKPRQNMKML